MKKKFLIYFCINYFHYLEFYLICVKIEIIRKYSKQYYLSVLIRYSVKICNILYIIKIFSKYYKSIGTVTFVSLNQRYPNILKHLIFELKLIFSFKQK